MIIANEEFIEGLKQNPINEEDRNFVYGTAGFRTNGRRLFGIAFRIGIFCVLRSMKQNGAVIGVMVTASHNKASDNGLKIIDKGGEMLEESWEQYAVQMIKVEPDNCSNLITEIIRKENIDCSCQGRVFIGQDTRETSNMIVDILCKGIRTTLNGSFANFGLVTTPQLHFLVLYQNSNPDTQVTNVDSYFQQISASYHKLCQQLFTDNHLSPLYLDCSNGIGSLLMSQVKKRLDHWLSHLVLCNTLVDEKHLINNKCGADYIKSKASFPYLHNCEVSEIQENQRWASIDGDADRFIYFYKKNNKLHILDGDKQSVIICQYIQQQLNELPAWKSSGLSYGVVQTAYANSGCTNWLTTKLKVPVICVPTGVKYLHQMGTELDVRLYFETNGHGSILLSKSARKFFNDTLPANHKLRLILLNGIINQAVGDSLSQLLLLEFILLDSTITNNQLDCMTVLESWYDLYDSLPYSQIQVAIADRRKIRTKNAERQVSEPVELQQSIDQLLMQYKKGGDTINPRVFVRPSGTEDVVRVYSEAANQELADQLTKYTAKLVYKLVGGVGVEP